MAVILLGVYLVAYFIGNFGAAAVNALAKKDVVSRRVAGLGLTLCAGFFYLIITAQALSKLNTSTLSNFDQGRVTGEVFANVLLPLVVVLVGVWISARREKKRSATGKANVPRVDPQ
ncbi:hypothetical protein [Variovorax fucosicus]|uniref:hypothetical protein n=1 Tax=Variovorax fucosicus TaxID=3053517 RepID=UPI0025773774|nr:hypothetical protein [Variovorax sp. J22G47]MDM0058995.1 hypothetical protein [Variovorax sp. J22G47]